MKRIFLTLAALSALLLIAAFALGLSIGDPKARDAGTQSLVGWHINLAMLALVVAALSHAIVLTYFMGTGRWIEETTLAYHLPDDLRAENRSIKYRTIPAMAGCLVLLVLTGALGSMADPASGGRFHGWLGMTPGTIHLLAACVTILANAAVNVGEYAALHRNGELIGRILTDVRRIRQERGLPV